MKALGSAFSDVPDKESAWLDLHRLAGDNDNYVRKAAAQALCSAFSDVPDKESAWQDLHRLAGDDDRYVRWEAADALSSAFGYIPDKQSAWQDLIQQAGDDNDSVRWEAMDTLVSAFGQVPDKQSAWQDLIRLASDVSSSVRWAATDILCSAFSDVPDKNSAWQDLILLTNDNDSYVRVAAVRALGSAFGDVPDRESVWQDLHRLAGDDNSSVRRETAQVLGSTFANVPYKDSAWQDLIRLAGDVSSFVRVSANNSLGRASVFKATESDDEDNFRRELENALIYFQKSATEGGYFNPSKFCLPFYRSFYFLTYRRDDSEEEIETYLKEAKKAVSGSKSKEKLLEAVENLAAALSEVQKLYNLNDVKSDLKAYMHYCNRAAELLDITEERAPGATRLVRRGLTIIDRRIKETISEIQAKARAICQVTRGMETPFEPLGTELNRQAKGLSDSNYLKSAKSCLRMSKIMKDLCRLLPQEKRGIACEIIDEIGEDNELEDNLSKLETALVYIQPNIEMEAYEIKLIQKMDEMNNKLDGIIYNISRIKIRSADAADGLRSLKKGLDQIKAIKSDIDGLDSKVEDLDISHQQALQELKIQMPRLICELETIAKDRDDKLCREILVKLDGLKRSSEETIFERAASLASIVSLLIALV